MNRLLTLFVLLAVALSGCATVRLTDPKSGVQVSYIAGSHNAVEFVHAMDERPYELASEAIDNGMSTSLAREGDGDVRFSAGYGYSGYGSSGSVGGYAAPNTGFIPGQGFVTGPPVSTLPPLATSVVVTGVPQTQATGQAIVPCPTDRLPQSVPEQAACAAAGVRSLTQNRTK